MLSKWGSFFKKKVSRFKKFQYLCTEEVKNWQFIPSLKEGGPSCLKPLKKSKL